MSSDDDWFERGISEDPVERDSDDESDAEAEHGQTEDATASVDTDTETDADTGAAPSAFDVGQSDLGGDGESPFEEDFSEAFNSAPTPDVDADAGAGVDAGAAGGGDAFPSGGDAFPGGDSDEMDIFGDDGQEFSDEDLDSSLHRLKIGIEGLDDMILGGIPLRSLIVSVGSAGTGKTTFGLQFLNTALEAGDRGVYITLEESRNRILDTAEEKGWDFRGYEEEGMLAIVDLDPVEMANSLSSIRNDLTRLIDEFGAERLVLDSVSLLEMMYDHPARRRSEVFGFTRALKRAGVTTLVTSESSDTDPFASRYGIIEYLADAVFVLRYVRSNSFQETRLAIEIQKVRDANHSRQPKPYDLTDSGIDVHQQANLF